MKGSICWAEPDICHVQYQPDIRGSMTENCQQSLRQFVGSTYSLMVVVVGGEGERKHRAEMPSLVAGWTGRLRALVYRDNSDLQTSTHVAVADKPSATSHDQLEHCHTVTPSSSPSVLVELLGNYSNLTTGWTLLKHWTPLDCTSQQHTPRGR